MRYPFICSLLLVLPFMLFSPSVKAQDVTHRLLEEQEIQQLIDEHHIETNYFPSQIVSIGYQYTDKSGKHILLIADSLYVSQRLIKPLKTSIMSFKKADKKLSKNWSFGEGLVSDEEGEEEKLIAFDEEYSFLGDLDKDGLADHILICASEALNGRDDGRILFTIRHKDQFVRIRHKNSVYDQGRVTKIDKTFYTLPQEIQHKVREIMQKMSKNQDAIFPAAYLEKMDARATRISEE